MGVMKVTTRLIATGLAISLSAVAHAQTPVPFEQLRLKDQRVLATPYWWAWKSPDDDVKAPLNVLTAGDAQRLIKAAGSPFAAFAIARGDMFYEPGVVIRHIFTSTLHSAINKPQVRVVTVYYSTTYAIREVVTNTIVYKNPLGGNEDVVHANSPYARFRYVVEDYAGDRVVGVNTDARGEVTECALIERAVLERPVTIWRMTPSYDAMLYQSKHKRENLFKLSTYGDGTWVVFEPDRLRPLYGQYTSLSAADLPGEQTWSFRFTYDTSIPDFLSSQACRNNPDVRRGYPESLAKLLGDDFPGKVRIAKTYALLGNDYLTFAIVFSQPLDEVARLVTDRLGKALNASLSPASVQIYGQRATRISLSRFLYQLNVEAIALDSQLTLVRGREVRFGGQSR